ncbi:hypothetical protein F5B22DRAFT_610629 [Xylaria bambusicola]|uniref:uncharacterized protein n=1 Tax=Xylaria bambusicola TaxID=326684 RepID=UPI00200766F6|nr:uncharacterized protein F5B22DRAFT_610629 [Xylaria bambusicola]KAI0514479.1 hypothetical protein F5B22DRAFT_610629 [Xylaria bambusicola]
MCTLLFTIVQLITSNRSLALSHHQEVTHPKSWRCCGLVSIHREANCGMRPVISVSRLYIIPCHQGLFGKILVTVK